MKIHHSGMYDIEEVLDEFKKQYNFENIVKKSTFFKFWSKIVGKKFQDKSKPISINKKNVLLVACENSMVTGELFMFKDAILEKMQVYTKPLNIKIDDIVFSHKIWQTEKEQLDEGIEFVKPTKIPDEELEKIILTEEEIASIKMSIEKIPFADKAQKDKMLNAIAKNLKLQKYKEQNKK